VKKVKTNLEQFFMQKVQFGCQTTEVVYGHMLIWHALAASTVQSRQFFASTLPEYLFEYKKWENHSYEIVSLKPSL
jgi:hypothetical protein